MAERFQLVGTTAGLLTGALFVLPVAGSAVFWAHGGGVPAAFLLAGSAAVVILQTTVFGRRPRTVEVLPGGDGIRIRALFRRWDLPGARVRTVTVVRQQNVETFAPTPYAIVTFEVEIPAGARPRLPGRARAEPPRSLLLLRLARHRASRVPTLLHRLRQAEPEAVQGRVRGGLGSVRVPDYPLSLERGFGGFCLLVLLMSGCLMLWIFGVTLGLDALAG